jgi:hypothetical protein
VNRADPVVIGGLLEPNQGHTALEAFAAFQPGAAGDLPADIGSVLRPRLDQTVNQMRLR